MVPSSRVFPLQCLVLLCYWWAIVGAAFLSASSGLVQSAVGGSLPQPSLCDQKRGVSAGIIVVGATLCLPCRMMVLLG